MGLPATQDSAKLGPNPGFKSWIGVALDIFLSLPRPQFSTEKWDPGPIAQKAPLRTEPGIQKVLP